LTLAYTVGSEQVYLNGVLQVRGSDYTATNGTSIVLTSGALVSDVLNVIAFSALALSDTYTQAQADAKFFQTANAFLAGKNKIINGDFNINQRNFTSTVYTGGNGNYDFDRWVSSTGGDSTSTITPQTFTPGAAPVAGYEGKTFYRCVTSGGTNSTTRADVAQFIESVRNFAGQTITVSFWAKAASGTPSIGLEVTQSFGSGGSPSSNVNTAGGAIPITTSWARYSATVAIPSISGKTIGTANNDYLGVRLWLSAGSSNATRASSIGIQNNTFDIWGVQAEAGSVATPFQTATGTIQGELAACQRYLPAITATGGNCEIGTGFNVSTTQPFVTIPFQVPARVQPTGITATPANMAVRNLGGSLITLTALAFNNASPMSCAVLGTVASGLVSGQGTSMTLQGTILFTGCEI
jgi:hypothetical protein